MRATVYMFNQMAHESRDRRIYAAEDGLLHQRFENDGFIDVTSHFGYGLNTVKHVHRGL